MTEDRIKRQPPEPERTMADLYPEVAKPVVKVHHMPEDFRFDKKRGSGPFEKLNSEEFERERRRRIRREDSWMGRGRGY